MNYAASLQQLASPDGRLFARVPLPPWLTAIFISFILIAFYATIRVILELDVFSNLNIKIYPFWAEADTVIFMSILLGYLYASEFYLRRGNLSDIEELQAHLRPSETEPTVDPLLAQLSRRGRLAMWLGGLSGLVYALFFTGSGAVFLSEALIEPFLPFAIVVFPVVFAQTARLIFLTNPLLSLFQHHYGDQFRIDVFDRTAYRPFVTMGLRSALRWLFQFAILVGLLLDEGNNKTIFGSLPMIYVIIIFAVVVATYEFLLPLIAARTFIMREKARESAWIIDAIKARRDSLKSDSAEQGATQPRMSDLLAFKRELDSMPDWPVESPDIGRFVIYLLIPAFSWFGAAGAEVLVEGFFGGR